MRIGLLGLLSGLCGHEADQVGDVAGLLAGALPLDLLFDGVGIQVTAALGVISEGGVGAPAEGVRALRDDTRLEYAGPCVCRNRCGADDPCLALELDLGAGVRDPRNLTEGF